MAHCPNGAESGGRGRAQPDGAPSASLSAGSSGPCSPGSGSSLHWVQRVSSAPPSFSTACLSQEGYICIGPASGRGHARGQCVPSPSSPRRDAASWDLLFPGEGTRSTFSVNLPWWAHFPSRALGAQHLLSPLQEGPWVEGCRRRPHAAVSTAAQKRRTASREVLTFLWQLSWPWANCEGEHKTEPSACPPAVPTAADPWGKQRAAKWFPAPPPWLLTAPHLKVGLCLAAVPHLTTGAVRHSQVEGRR